MNLSLGIVGLPNVGKSTLFEALTKKEVNRQNYPFCTIDPNVGVVPVKDERVDQLSQLLKIDKKIYATIEFIDIAGLVKGAHQGEGLGNQFLAHIREVNAIVYLLRCFKNPNIINTLDRVDPLLEKEILETELILKDLETVNKRLADLSHDLKSGNKEVLKEKEVLDKAQTQLVAGKPLHESEFNEEEKKILRLYQFLTLKPCLYLLNGQKEEIPAEIIETFEKNHWNYLILDVLLELEAIDLTPEERKNLGLESLTGLDQLINSAYKLLDLITFFTTTGETEVRAWPIKKGTKVPQAGGLIHSDFENKFIRAEVISFYDLIKAGGYGPAREQGLIRLEGKDYVVQDGDIVEIKINV